MNEDKLGTQIESQKMTRGGSVFDQTTIMVPAVGVTLMLVLMAVFYVYYRRKNRRHSLRPPQSKPAENQPASRSGRKRGQTLAESGGLPPSRTSSKEATS